MVPTTQRACFLTGSQLPSYDHFKHLMLRHGWMEEGKPLHFLSSMVAGMNIRNNAKLNFPRERSKGG